VNRYLTKRNILIAVGIYCFVAVIICGQAGLAGEELEGYEQGLDYYERNEIDKAITTLKGSLVKEFAKPTNGELQKAVALAQNDKAGEAEKILLLLLEDEENAARARYELGLIYEKQGKLDAAATMFRNAQVVIADKGAVYLGISACKKCHFKLYRSWKKTKTAKSFEMLKPGVAAEVKSKLKFDPQKDYTRDPKCLECHTTGFGLPGGYKIPEPGDTKAAKRAKENAGITCEGCHGPGSNYIPVLKDVMFKKQKYTQRQLCDLGMFKVGARVCSKCHNSRNPTAETDLHFDFDEYKAKDTHEHFPLKYQIEE
jgi:tetratricopeptide (TPR) repeat protein